MELFPSNVSKSRRLRLKTLSELEDLKESIELDNKNNKQMAKRIKKIN
jgi:hypothetical protein